MRVTKLPAQPSATTLPTSSYASVGQPETRPSALAAGCLGDGHSHYLQGHRFRTLLPAHPPCPTDMLRIRSSRVSAELSGPSLGSAVPRRSCVSADPYHPSAMHPADDSDTWGAWEGERGAPWVSPVRTYAASYIRLPSSCLASLEDRYQTHFPSSRSWPRGGQGTPFRLETSTQLQKIAPLVIKDLPALTHQ